MMPETHKQLKIKSFFVFFLTAALLLPALTPSSAARKPIRWRAKKIVVVDPGHGGRDFGARGTGGALEKTVTLALARQIESVLKSRCKVKLTRTGDYGLEIIRRTDVANHLKADVFVSIHTGGSFQHDARGMRVYYFRESRSNSPSGSLEEINSWDRIQLKHLKDSGRLADFIRKRLQETVPTKRCEVDTAPLLVLRGADMPSVLIEIGTLTNTEDEKQLSASENLDALGRAIADGINDFFRHPTGKSDP